MSPRARELASIGYRHARQRVSANRLFVRPENGITCSVTCSVESPRATRRQADTREPMTKAYFSRRARRDARCTGLVRMCAGFPSHVSAILRLRGVTAWPTSERFHVRGSSTRGSPLLVPFCLGSSLAAYSPRPTFDNERTRVLKDRRCMHTHERKRARDRCPSVMLCVHRDVV